MTMREAHARRSRCVRGICGRSRRLVGLGRRLGVVLLLAALACVEGTQTADNGGMSGTGISQGAIDSFGSIFVNGVEWRTGSASRPSRSGAASRCWDRNASGCSSRW